MGLIRFSNANCLSFTVSKCETYSCDPFASRLVIHPCFALKTWWTSCSKKFFRTLHIFAYLSSGFNRSSSHFIITCFDLLLLLYCQIRFSIFFHFHLFFFTFSKVIFIIKNSFNSKFLSAKCYCGWKRKNKLLLLYQIACKRSQKSVEHLAEFFISVHQAEL